MPSSGSGCWRRISGSGRWCRSRDGSEQRKWLLAPHQRKWPLMQVKKDHQTEVAAGAPSVEAAADVFPAEKVMTQRQMAGQMTSSVWHLLTQRHRRCQSDSGPNKMSRLRRRDLHRLVQRKLRAWMRRLRALTWPGCVRRRGRNLPHRR